jgi:hypothetical protein
LPSAAAAAADRRLNRRPQSLAALLQETIASNKLSASRVERVRAAALPLYAVSVPAGGMAFGKWLRAMSGRQ